MNNKNVTIKDGQGSINLTEGTYQVEAQVIGYNNISLDPKSLEVTELQNNYAFKIEALGTLILHVTEEGTSEGTPVSGAKFKRCDKDGNEYGNEITTNEQGNAAFEKVPFAESDAPLIYFKQTATDQIHTYTSTLQNTSLDSSTKTLEIQNPLAQLRTITLTDANYENLPIEQGTLIVTI